MTTKQKQCLLYYLGFYKGNIDGKFGPASKKATKAFQEAYGLAADGEFGAETEKVILKAIAGEMKPVDFWDEIKYFKREEFKCKCGKHCNGFPVDMNQTLIRVADRVRGHFGDAATVSSGVRCTKHNSAVGGTSGSRHKLGKAMDFCIKGKTAQEVLAYVKKQPEIRYCYAIDSRYVHMDVN